MKPFQIPPESRQGADNPQRVIAEGVQPHLAGALYHAFRRLRERLTPVLLHRAILSGHVLAAIAPELHLFQNSLASTKVFLAHAHAISAADTARRIPGPHTLRKIGREYQMSALSAKCRQIVIRKADVVSFDLDSLPQATQNAVEDYDYGMVREITDDVRTMIAAAVSDGIQQGWAPDKIARAIRASIGLTDAQAKAVDNYRSFLSEGNPLALQRALRDHRFDETVEGSQDTGVALSDDMIDKLVQRYEDRYLAFRSNTVARYEALRASNGGMFDSVQDAVDDGSLDPANVTVRWLIADDEATCSRCRSIIELQPDGVPWGTPFQWASPPTRKGRVQSGSVMVAPLHPLCRCSVTYRVVSDENA